MMLAYHSRQELKIGVLAMLAVHREADTLTHGHGYWDDGKGCAVGCTLESIRRFEGLSEIEHGEHALYQRYLGIPTALARIEDGLFESLPVTDAKQWPERFLSAIAPGADLSMVVPRFLHWLLTDPEGGVQAGVTRRPSIAPAVQCVADLYARWIGGTKPSDTEWREASQNAYADAAYADAAYAADASAAYAYAETAADAAYAAAAAAYAETAAADAAYAADASAAYAYAETAAAAAYAETAAADASAAYASAASAADAYADAAYADAARYRSRQRQADKIIALLQSAPMEESR